MQHKDLQKLLLNTENQLLIEHTPLDNYWGDGGNGSGKNRLGQLLRNDKKINATPACRQAGFSNEQTLFANRFADG